MLNYDFSLIYLQIQKKILLSKNMELIPDASIIRIKCGRREHANKLDNGNIGALGVISTNAKLAGFT